MDMTDYYDINYTKSQLNKFLEEKVEPELCIKIAGKEYMIIPLRTKISFQWLSHTEEFYYDSVEELFSSELINGIILNRDWEKVEDIWYF